MIIKSFLRNASTKIYLIIISILFLAISLLFASIEYLNKLQNLKYYDISLLYVEGNKDNVDAFLKRYELINIHKVLTFNYLDDLIDRRDLVELELDNKVLVYADELDEYNLNENEVIINLESGRYDNNKPYFPEYINHNIKLSFESEFQELTIKDIKSNNRGSIIISSKLFEKLESKVENESYTANFITEEIANEFYVKQSSYSKNVETLNLDSYNDSTYQTLERLNKYLKTVKLASYVCIVIFIIVLTVVNKNIISDSNKNIILEKRMGYNRIQIKSNILKRLSILHIISYFITLMISIILVIIFNLVMNTQVSLGYIVNSTIIAILVLISDLLLSLIVNDKSNINRRRKAI